MFLPLESFFVRLKKKGRPFDIGYLKYIKFPYYWISIA